MKELNLFVPHAILFLYDLGHDDVVVPEYIDNELTAHNESCLSVGTQSEVDGEVHVKLSNEFSGADIEPYNIVFDGLINTPQRKLAVSSSEDEGLLEVDVSDGDASIKIWVDDLDFPSTVLIQAK